MVFVLIVCILSISLLAGCTTENHRVMVTVKNLRDTSQNIRLYVDGEGEFSGTVDPGASVEQEYELAPGKHTFELYQVVSSNWELYKTETIELESDSSIFFELE